MKHKRLGDAIFLILVAFLVFFLDRDGLGIGSFFIGVPAFAVAVALIVGPVITKYSGQAESHPSSKKSMFW